MNTNTNHRDEGFTLVEILIAIVLVGILSAVVVVGVGSLTDQGNQSACTASLDAAKAGSVVYFAQNGDYPTDISEMTTDGALEIPSDVTVDTSDNLSMGNGTWTLTMTSTSNTVKPTFACS